MAFVIKFTAPHDGELVLVLEHCFERREDAVCIAKKINSNSRNQAEGVVAWVAEVD